MKVTVKRPNLEEALLKERKKHQTEQALLEEVKAILAHDEDQRTVIKNKLTVESSTKSNKLNLELLETDKIFHLDQVRKICVDYRFRFLDVNLFKGTVPEEAISKIKNLEKMHHAILDGFKIMAPSKLFHLKNHDDPLLFVPIGNNYFYLIHKWGNDINPLRKIAVRPFKNMQSLMVLLLILSLLLAFIVPENALGTVNPDILVALSFLFIFKSLCGITLYYAFWKGKNFNEFIWDSNYYN
ncbi:MAG: hypothetical protein PSV16_11145 [Flavobacterium sp.]|nr:hypothetical protein [Flavobacterium sp.]